VNQSFTFDVRELKSAQITLQVVARGVLGIEEALGHINNLCVLNLLEVGIWLLHLFFWIHLICCTPEGMFSHESSSFYACECLIDRKCC
jgi:hypothetical protein